VPPKFIKPIAWIAGTGTCGFCEQEKVFVLHTICRSCAFKIAGLYRRKSVKELIKKHEEKRDGD